jgi:acyl carrier protein
MNTDIEKTIKEIIKKSVNAEISMDKIRPNDDLGNLGMTSRNFLKVVVEIENEWEFEFDDEFLNYDKLRTLKDISAYIKTKIN